MNLSQLIYISDATKAMTTFGIEQLISSCQQKNSDCNITGLLLYSGGHFIQLLEGHRPVLANALARISKDTRHQNVQQLYFENATIRLFPKWQMGLLNLDTISELDRAKLQTMIDHLTTFPSGLQIMSLLREFRQQLPAAAGKFAKAA